MRKIVHQIWIGDTIPKREFACIQTIRTNATEAGWQHTLWTLDALVGMVPGDRAARKIYRIISEHPGSGWCGSLASDYWRYALVSALGGLYLDTDFVADSWPEFPKDDELYGMNEWGTRSQDCLHPNGCALYLRPGAPVDAVESIREKAAMRILDPETEYSKKNLRDIIGPAWLREIKVKFKIFPEDMVSHIQWNTFSPLIHMGFGTWIPETMQ